jgi:hypothetical protein
MAFIKRAGLTGALAGTFFVAMMVFRGATPNAVLPAGTSQPTPAATSGGGSSPSNALPRKWQQEGPWKASRQHFAGIQTEEECPSLEGKEIHDARSQVWCIKKDLAVRAMIAIVPDPIHSHLSLAFDRTIEALQLSAETINYEMDRYWLPWRPATPGSSAGTAESQDAEKKEKEPGLLLFRWNGSADAPDPKALYVFLVSDTSTAGVNGSQFSNAVQYVQQVCGKPGAPALGCGKDDHILIMGPTFSGALASLRSLTDAAPLAGNRPDFTAYSGTISSTCAIKNQGLLDKSFSTDNLPPTCSKEISNSAAAREPAPAPHLTVASLVGDSETMVQDFIQELQEKGNIDCKSSVEVAILSEAATTYGGVTVTKTPGEQNSCPYTSFRYPREISSLRNASASSAQPAAAPAQPGDAQAPSYLPFTLADQQPNYGDEPADFSGAQGPLSKESVMMKYAAELRREHYKYVGIIGTNVVDVLYLAKFLRTACPDVRLFILNSDLLFERDLDNAPYIGTLSLSTYPLLGHDPEWHGPRNLLPRLPFADQFAQGQYNAALLAMHEALQDGTEPHLRDVSEPFLGTGNRDPKSGALPLWLTAVGTGGYWPVQLIPPKSLASPANEGQQAATPPLDSDDFSPAWRALALFLTGFAFLLSWVLWTVPPVGTRFHDFALINEAPAQRFFFINVASASVACTLVLFLTPALKFGMSADRTVPGIVVVMLLAIATLVACNLYLWRLLQKIRRTEDSADANRSYRWSTCFSLLAWATAGLGASLWWRLFADDSTHYGFFFGYRSVNLASGVSPLTPILLLLCAIFLWSLFEILRLRFDKKIRPRLNLKDVFPGAKTESDIASSINAYLLSVNYSVIFLLVFVAWFFFLHPARPFELFEKSTFGWAYEVLFAVVVALMLANGLRLAQTWTQLNILLRQLERSPIRGFFRRLKQASWSPIWQSGGQQAEWTNMARSFEVMQRIRNCNDALDPALTGDIDAAMGKLEEVRKQVRSKSLEDLTGLHALQERFVRLFRKPAKEAVTKPAENPIAGFRVLEKLYSDLQAYLAAVLTDVMKILQTEWKDVCYEPVDVDEAGKEDRLVVVNCCKEEFDKKLADLARLEEYVALRYVAFIRGVLGNIRLWLILQAIVFSLVLSSLNVYSFEPHRSLVWSFTALFVLIGAIAIQVLMQAHRDPVISRITGTKPNELGIQFYIRIATLGAVPLLTLLATHFPSIGHYLMSFFQPGLEALK